MTSKVDGMRWYVGTEWSLPSKGLRKQVLSLDFHKLRKPHMCSKVLINMESCEHRNGRPSVYLNTLQKDIEMEMGTALTPLDCYLETLVQQMIEGEKALCSIQTKKDATNIEIILTLKSILHSKETHLLTVQEMYDLALRYKENGVKMFKSYPLFAHDYFVRAAKCLISYKKFDGLTKAVDGVAGVQMQELFQQIQTNLAASLLAEQRYEDVIYQTNFVKSVQKPSDKSVYRRAMAYFYLKEFELAQNTIDMVPEYRIKKEFINLQQRIHQGWQVSNHCYKNMIQKMFN